MMKQSCEKNFGIKNYQAGILARKLSFFLLLFVGICFIMKDKSGILSAEEERNPFLSLSDKVKVEESYFDLTKLSYSIKLNGIIWKNDYPVAIINNEIVEIGQDWKDFKILGIEQDKVVLQHGKFKYEIFLLNEEKKL